MLVKRQKSKITKKRTCWLFTENRSLWKNELDRYLTMEIFFLRLWGIEERNVSSSSFTCASRRRWSSSFLENQRKSAESIPTVCWLVWRSMESMFGSRMIQEQLFPSSSRTFRMQPYWSFITRQCCDSEQFLPIYIFTILDVCSICIVSSTLDWYWEVKIRAKESILSACRSHGQTIRIQTRSTWMCHVMHNTCIMHGRVIKTQYIGSTSILLFRKDFSSIRLSNAIILHETLPACCIPKVVRMKTGDVFYEKVYMSPRPPPKISWKIIGFGSCSTTRRRSCSTSKILPTNPTNPETNLWSIGESWAQPTPNLIRERSGRPDNRQDGRNTYRSQEINVNSLSEELSSAGKNEATCWDRCNSNTFIWRQKVSMLNRLMKERSDLLLLLMRLMRKTALEYVLLMEAIRSSSKKKR